MKKTTIIMPAFLNTQLSVQMTVAAAAQVTKYTDPSMYEFILIEDIPRFPFDTAYPDIKIDNHIILNKLTNYATKMNIAAKIARTDTLCFIQNDVFVFEGWLEGLWEYFDHNLLDCVIPDQFPRSREYMKQINTLSLEDSVGTGGRDAGLLMIKKQSFEKTGGFNENLEALVERDFYERMGKVGINYASTAKVQIAHIKLGTHYQDMESFDKKVTHDSNLLNT